MATAPNRRPRRTRATRARMPRRALRAPARRATRTERKRRRRRARRARLSQTLQGRARLPELELTLGPAMPSPEETRREIAELREAIDKLDRALLASLEERARLSRKIHSLVEAFPTAIDVDEAQWLRGLETQSSGVLAPSSLRAIF